MFREHRECPPIVGEVADAQAVVGHEWTQFGREVVQKHPRLKFPFERPPDGRQTDEEIRVRSRRSGWCGGILGLCAHVVSRLMLRTNYTAETVCEAPLFGRRHRSGSPPGK